MTVYVYGASDDLIEIEGDLSEEFGYTPPTYSHHDAKPYYLGFSDGTLLKITYDGEWNIKLIKGEALIYPAGFGSAEDINDSVAGTIPAYSDVAVIHSDVTWVVGGTDVIK